MGEIVKNVTSQMFANTRTQLKIKFSILQIELNNQKGWNFHFQLALTVKNLVEE
jgi:hypothetical protein